MVKMFSITLIYYIIDTYVLNSGLYNLTLIFISGVKGHINVAHESRFDNYKDMFV